MVTNLIVQGLNPLQNIFWKGETVMKLFEMPIIEVLKFDVQDVIATSEPLPPEPSEAEFCA